MKLDLTSASLCAKCGSVQGIQRHHKGCEKMWLRHFARRAGTKQYDDFLARYWEFRESDIVRLCIDCHKKIHKIYFRIIGRWATKHGKCSKWSWPVAHALMNALRNRCDLWLKPKPRLSLRVKHRAK